MLTEEQVRKALEAVEDPELGLDIVNLGLVYGVQVDGAKVSVDVTLTSPMCPVGPMIVEQAKSALEALEGVEEANVEVVWEPPWSMEMMSEDLKFMLGRG